MNIFEGARRISHVIAGIPIVFALVISITEKGLGAFMYAIPYLALWLFGWYVSVWVIGWVVRGFMGIPLGSDEKDF